MRRGVAKLLRLGHRLAGRRRHRRRDNNEYPILQNVCLSFSSTAFVLIWSLQLAARHMAKKSRVWGSRFQPRIGNLSSVPKFVRAIASLLNGSSGLVGKSGRKTASACDSNAIEMSTETTAYFILAAKNTFTETLVSWRNPAVNVGNRTRCEFLQVKLSLDRPGLGSTLESTQARSRRDKFAIAFAAYRMPRALTTLLPEDHRSVEKQSCKRWDNNDRRKHQKGQSPF